MMINTKILTISVSLFYLLWFIIIAFSSPSLQTSPPSLSSLTSSSSDNNNNNNQPQSFRIKKQAVRVFLNSRQNKNLEKVVLYRSKSEKTKMSSVDDYQRRFSAMLPKGYVAPSRSSACHNVYPNSVTFFCELADEMS
ncbi:hypothetical protein CASFOL_039291 [Castilleja foliolosa]|uniref:Uncharacterized protein n=1 Tax=Castilleja foliolosa TaxID=1961234 RepID=A0ABD3BI23_9LAMI